MRRLSKKSVVKLGNSTKWNCRTILFVLLAVWVLGFIIFFFYFHTNDSNTMQRNFGAAELGKIKSEILTRQKSISFKAMQHKMGDKARQEEKLMMEDINVDKSMPGMEQLLFVSSRLKSQMDLPLEQRRIYEPIQLPDISKYSQPREVYDKIKSEFENAEWQPETGK